MPVALLSSPGAPTARVLPSPDSATLLPKLSLSPVLLALKYPMALVRSTACAADSALHPALLHACTRYVALSRVCSSPVTTRS